MYLDEIALKKGHGNFETVISSDTRVLEMVEGKSSETIQAALKAMPGIERIEQVCMDMCASFAHAVKAVLPKAKIVIDRFHLIRHANDALESIRKRHYAKLDGCKRKRFARINWLLFKDYASLHKDNKRLVREYLRLDPETARIYWLVQELRSVLKTDWKDRMNAYYALFDWCEKARRYLTRLVKTIENWWNPVLNACFYPLNNGRQEGINNKIKLIKRQGYGFKDRGLFRLKVFAAFNP